MLPHDVSLGIPLPQLLEAFGFPLPVAFELVNCRLVDLLPIILSLIFLILAALFLVTLPLPIPLIIALTRISFTVIPITFFPSHFFIRRVATSLAGSGILDLQGSFAGFATAQQLGVPSTCPCHT